MSETSQTSTPHALPVAGDEVATVLGVLDRNRRTFAWKVSGLDAEQLRARLAPSTLTLGGLVKHLALVEDFYFALRLDADMPAPWRDVDWDAEPDWCWTSAADDTPEELLGLWMTSVQRSRAAVARALERGDLGQPVRYADGEPELPNLRRTLMDMVEEYARHTGHADLLRESIDGLTGEDAPRDAWTP